MNMIRTERLILRRAALDDLECLHGILSDPQAMRYWSTPPHPNRETTQIQLAKMVARADPPVYFMFEHNSRVIGMGGMHGFNEIGYILHPDYWRQGFVREAMNAIISHIWNTTNRASIFADTDPNNVASIGLLKALGFVETHRATRTYCVNGVWSDSVYFGLERPV